MTRVTQRLRIVLDTIEATEMKWHLVVNFVGGGEQLRAMGTPPRLASADFTLL